ncbi:Do family serine endopeptidase [Limibaculum sp. FT325]|uniref:Do family serine endopeptidase n=1 Tax=Thermohalobaculum sediminis TaxID=2939436 RepID=UPI0020BE878D|nr:Do family serine endopeptidase [Limibaculum sediminis]MCL5775810.1 Do family serine endopeptidase [Limibaculum sediminis]
MRAREIGKAIVLAASLTALVPPAAAQQVPQTREEITLSFAPVVRKAAPAVVNIYTRKVVTQRPGRFAGDPFFERFFGDFFGQQVPERRRIENSLGSGVIVDAEGIVVSNHHVVGDADEITVILHDRREFEARVIFTDEAADLAVLELDGAEDLPTLELRDSDTLEVGDLVLAIGNPFGVGQTVTSGIISGLARSAGRAATRQGYFIQTDAAINPGNSGGALVDMKGRLVGVNTAILSRTGGSIGIGFAVPANLVARVIDAALSGAEGLARPWLGIAGREVTGDLAEALGLGVPSGVLVEQIHPESPLAELGLIPGDVILGIDGVAVNSPGELDFRTATLGIGQSVTISYLSRGVEREARLRLAAAPETPPRERMVLERAGRLTGLDVVTVNPGVIAEARLPLMASGVLVMDAAGPSGRAGLRRGDVIRAVNGREIAGTADLGAALGNARGEIVLEVLRGGRRGNITVRG